VLLFGKASSIWAQVLFYKLIGLVVGGGFSRASVQQTELMECRSGLLPLRGGDSSSCSEADDPIIKTLDNFPRDVQQVKPPQEDNLSRLQSRYRRKLHSLRTSACKEVDGNDLNASPLNSNSSTSCHQLGCNSEDGSSVITTADNVMSVANLYNSTASEDASTTARVPHQPVQAKPAETRPVLPRLSKGTFVTEGVSSSVSPNSKPAGFLGSPKLKPSQAGLDDGSSKRVPTFGTTMTTMDSFRGLELPQVSDFSDEDDDSIDSDGWSSGDSLAMSDDNPKVHTTSTKKAETPDTTTVLRDACSAFSDKDIHLVCPYDVVDGNIRAFVQPGPISDIQLNARPIVVVTLLRNLRLGHVCVNSFLEAHSPRRPIVVVIFHLGEQFDRELVIDAQRSFRELGVLNTILAKDSSDNNLSLQVDMAVHRFRHCVTDLQKELDAQLLKHDNSFFWQHAHRVHDGFQKLEPKVSMTSVNPGDMIGEHCLHEMIGRGGFSTVYRGMNCNTGEEEAIKVIHKANAKPLRAVEALWREHTLPVDIDHPNICRLRQVIHGSNFLFFIMDLCGKRNLHRHIREHVNKRLPAVEAYDVLDQLLNGLGYFHARGLSHRDVKPENICVRSQQVNKIKLLDFGCVIESTRLSRDKCGTMPFIAPEVLLQQHAYMPAPTDIWSSGVVLLEMMYGITKLEKLLGWNTRPKADRVHGKDIVRFLSDPSKLAASLEDDLADPKLKILLGLLAIAPQTRWTADFASYNLQEQLMKVECLVSGR
jgi:serine/threonine protein kinase